MPLIDEFIGNAQNPTDNMGRDALAAFQVGAQLAQQQQQLDIHRQDLELKKKQNESLKQEHWFQLMMKGTDKTLDPAARKAIIEQAAIRGREIGIEIDPLRMKALLSSPQTIDFTNQELKKAYNAGDVVGLSEIIKRQMTPPQPDEYNQEPSNDVVIGIANELLKNKKTMDYGRQESRDINNAIRGEKLVDERMRPIAKAVETYVQTVPVLDDVLKTGDAFQIRSMFGNLYARGLAGEKGPLNEQDIARSLQQTLGGKISTYMNWLGGKETLPESDIKRLQGSVDIFKSNLGKNFYRNFQNIKAENKASVGYKLSKDYYDQKFNDQEKIIRSYYDPTDDLKIGAMSKSQKEQFDLLPSNQKKAFLNSLPSVSE